MHIEAQRFIETAARLVRPKSRAQIDVVEFGGLDVNGGLRHLYPYARWISVDIEPGPGVDIVADAADWKPDESLPYAYDLVICAEVFEHTQRWGEIIVNAMTLMKEDGAFICTAATDPRAPHGAYDPDGTHGFRDGEYYRNVNASALLHHLRTVGFRWIDLTVDGGRGDVYVCARL